MTFEYPWFFLLLIPFAIVLAGYWFKRIPALRVPSIRPFEKASVKRGVSPRKLIPFILYAFAGLAMITALAKPREGIEEIRSKAEGIDIMLAIDLSGSMNAIDAPRFYSDSQISDALRSGALKNRLETAKAEITKFIEERPNDRIGLIAFAELPFVVCPPTLDHAFLLANLSRLELGVIGDGTGIASPIASAVKRLKDSKAKSRIMVLFTDGANTVPAAITPLDAGKLADTFKITIYTVGIGSPNAKFPSRSIFGGIEYRSYPGQFDEKLLKALSSMTGGKYYHAADAEGLSNAMADINALERTSAEQPIVILWKELYPVLCSIAVCAIMVAVLLQNSILLKIP